VVSTLVAAVRRATLLAAARRHVELAPEDGLDPALLRGQVEVDGAEEVAVIGERDGGKLERLGLGHELVELSRSIEQAVLRMNVEMDELAMLQRLHSHSIVAGGFEEISKTTRLIPLTSLMIRLLIFESKS